MTPLRFSKAKVVMVSVSESGVNEKCCVAYSSCRLSAGVASRSMMLFHKVQFPSIRQALTMTNCRRMKTGESTLELSRPSFPNDLSVSFWHSKYLKTNRRARVERLHENRKNAALYVC